MTKGETKKDRSFEVSTASNSIDFAKELSKYLPEDTELEYTEEMRPDFKDINKRLTVHVYRMSRYTIGVYIPVKAKGFIYTAFINSLLELFNNDEEE